MNHNKTITVMAKHAHHIISKMADVCASLIFMFH